MTKQTKQKKIKAYISKVGNEIIEVRFSEPFVWVEEIMKFGESGKIIKRWYPCEITYSLPTKPKKSK